MDGTKTAKVGDTFSETFMRLLKRHRIAAGLTQQGLAKAVKRAHSTVSGWESGKCRPTADVIPDLADALGLDAMALTRVIYPEPLATTSRS